MFELCALRLFLLFIQSIFVSSQANSLLHNLKFVATQSNVNSIFKGMFFFRLSPVCCCFSIVLCEFFELIFFVTSIHAHGELILGITINGKCVDG